MCPHAGSEYLSTGIKNNFFPHNPTTTTTSATPHKTKKKKKKKKNNQENKTPEAEPE